MDQVLALKVAVLQLSSVAILSILLAIALPKSFFEDWGWIVGPSAWIACAALTARALELPLRFTLLGAALAGLPSIIAVVIGIHWLGTVIAVGLFAAWCDALMGRKEAWT